MENTKARREAAVLVVVVFLLGILLGGVGNHLWGAACARDARRLRSARAARASGMTEFTQELQLTPDSRNRLQRIIGDSERRWRELYTPLDADGNRSRAGARDRFAQFSPRSSSRSSMHSCGAWTSSARRTRQQLRRCQLRHR